MIKVDGYNLKGLYRGVLLANLNIDANYGIYPLAMFVIETKNNDSWQYYMEKLYDQVIYNLSEGLWSMNGKQKGVFNALDWVLPLSLKRHYYRHIYVNLKISFISFIEESVLESL